MKRDVFPVESWKLWLDDVEDEREESAGQTPFLTLHRRVTGWPQRALTRVEGSWAAVSVRVPLEPGCMCLWNAFLPLICWSKSMYIERCIRSRLCPFSVQIPAETEEVLMSFLQRAFPVINEEQRNVLLSVNTLHNKIHKCTYSEAHRNTPNKLIIIVMGPSYQASNGFYPH